MPKPRKGAGEGGLKKEEPKMHYILILSLNRWVILFRTGCPVLLEDSVSI